jgi:hypothetical protein
VVAGGAAKDKEPRYVQGSEYKEVDRSRSTRSEHVDVERRKRSSKRADRYIGPGVFHVIVAVQVAAVLRGRGGLDRKRKSHGD